MFSSKTIYLCGTMSHIKSYGLGWRKKIKKWLDERGVVAYDPCTEEIQEHNQYDIKRDQKHQWEKFPQPLQEEILKKDLDQIKLYTKYIICFFTRYSTGTVSELSFALYNKIPVYLVTARKLIGWPYTVGNAEGNKVFKTFEQLKSFLSVKYKLKRRKNVKPRKA